jgi:IS5 family transposase
MARNYLKGFVGDEINLLLAASAFNLKKWMNNFILLFIALRVAVIVYALREETPIKREKYLQLFLLLLKLW